jgi:hypothetical protein
MRAWAVLSGSDPPGAKSQERRGESDEEADPPEQNGQEVLDECGTLTGKAEVSRAKGPEQYAAPHQPSQAIDELTADAVRFTVGSRQPSGRIEEASAPSVAPAGYRSQVGASRSNAYAAYSRGYLPIQARHGR